MTISREHLLSVAYIPASRNQKFAGLFIIGGSVSLYLNGFSYPMVVQIALAMICVVAFQISLNRIRTNRHFDHLKTLKITDIPSIAFCLFTLGYYVLYYGYTLFVSFSWTNLGLLALNFVVTIAFFQNSSAYNVFIGNAKLYADKDELEVTEDEWTRLLGKWQIEQPGKN